MTSWITANVWVLPAVPLAAALIILALDTSRRRQGAALAISGQIIAFILALMAFAPTLHALGFRAFNNFTWFTFGEQTLRIGWMLDPLAAAMLVMITLVGLAFWFQRRYRAATKIYAVLRLPLVSPPPAAWLSPLCSPFLCCELSDSRRTPDRFVSNVHAQRPRRRRLPPHASAISDLFAYCLR